MKKTTRFLVGLVLVLAGGALVSSLLRARPRISMTLLEYQRWPHGALLRLSNGSRETIRYLAEPNGTPAGSPALCLQKTPTGWTNLSPTVKSAMAYDSRTGKTIEVFFLADPALPPNPGDRLTTVLARDLKPGQSVEFFVGLDPGGYPKRIGTVYCVQQGRFAKALQSWLFRIKKWCRIKTTPTIPPGRMEVWCPEPLYVSSSPQPATTN